MDLQVLQSSINRWIEEDVGNGDHTSLSTIPSDAKGSATIHAKEDGLLAGIRIAEVVLMNINKSLQLTPHTSDGETIHAGDKILSISGDVRAILKAERLVLNIMQRMSGIATSTNQYVKRIAHTNARLLDTRKTTPGFRMLEKEAVRIGGGTNHRFGLFDMIMIKDNHIDFAGGIAKAIQSCLLYLEKNSLDLKIEVEVRSLEDIKEVLKTGQVHRILLDNFTIEMTKEAVELIGDRSETESSGGINPDTIKSYAECGVNYISVGALTHQIKSLDLSLLANF